MLARRPRQSIVRLFIDNPALVCSLILLIGFFFSYNKADFAGLQQGQVGLLESGKGVRVITVALAAVFGFVILGGRGGKGFEALFKGSVLYMSLYGLLAIGTVVFSKFPSMTVFKGGEMLVIVSIAGLILTNKNRESSVIFYCKGIFWIYVFFSVSAMFETLFLGTEHHKQLVGETPLLATMMHSSYPPMVGNALGFLGALVGLFAMYLGRSGDIKNKKLRMLISLGLFVLGASIVFLSYTRSILIFFGLTFLVYSWIEKKRLRVIVILTCVMVALATPKMQTMVADHFRKGMSDEQLESMSGRTTFWGQIFGRNILNLMVGEGFATGAAFQNLGGGHVTNAHNSVAEVVLSAGLLGASIWLIIVFRTLFNMLKIRKMLRRLKAKEEIIFHNFMLMVGLLSLMRCVMNATFVYLTYFSFVFIALVLYSEVKRMALRSRIAKVQYEYNQQNTEDVSTSAIANR